MKFSDLSWYWIFIYNLLSFLYSRLKNGTYYGNTCGVWAGGSTGFPLSKSKSFYQVFIKFGEYVGGHNISTKVYNKPNPPRHS